MLFTFPATSEGQKYCPEISPNSRHIYIYIWQFLLKFLYFFIATANGYGSSDEGDDEDEDDCLGKCVQFLVLRCNICPNG